VSEKRSNTLKYKSETKVWINASNSPLEFGTTAMGNKRGPNGGRLVVKQATAHFIGDVTVATAALQGEDFYRFFRTLDVKTVLDGMRYNNVPGDAMRVFLYGSEGGDRTKEHADSGVSANQTLRATLSIPFERRYMHTPEDYALAAELIERIKIGCALASEMSLGTSVVTINSGSYYIVFECVEEHDIIYHAIDEVRTQDFESTTATEPRLNVNGRLQELFLFVRGAEGGASLANLTSAWIHQPQNMAPELNVVPDLVDYYGRERFETQGGSATTGVALRSNPFLGSGTSSLIRAAAVLMSNGTRAFDQPETDTVIVKTTHTLGATLTMVARIAKPRTKDTFDRLKNDYGLKGAWRIKTSAKSMQHPAAWADRKDAIPYLPIKFVA